MTSNIRSRAEAGFTLVELLMVIVVLTILFGISLTAIRTVARNTHKTVTRSELKSIESAFKQYYAHYQSWPLTNETADASSPIEEALADILMGTEEGTALSNPDKLVFMEFARVTKKGVPLNSWGESGRFKEEACRYHVAFDTDGDNRIMFPTNNVSDWAAFREKTSSGSEEATSTRNLRRSVIVWTFDPELTPGDEDYLLGSWQQ